ncbi:MAG: succinate dehydrogenase, cytochrome b556 subunit [Thiohalomonadaceae bacterium]
MIDRNARPVYLDLRRIRLPVTAWVSLGHRVSGVLLFLALAPGLWLLQTALEGPEGYAAAATGLSTVSGRLFLVLLAWSLAHHLFAGLRVLLLDVHVGVSLAKARASAVATLFLGAVILFAAAVLVW